MSSPELETLIAKIRARPVFELPLDELRRTFDAMAFPLPEDVACEIVDADGVRSAWITPPNVRADRVILYLHGGGYMIGSIVSHRTLVANVSRAAGARGLAVEYRLAPECPFPAAVDDATRAYRWLLAKGIDPRRIVIAGDSAGGGLAVATLVNLRDQGEPLPATGVCLSPWVDLEGLGESMNTRAARDPLVAPALIQRMAKAYLGGADCRSPLAAPLHADLSGLPPLLIQVGGSEILYDDAVRLAERARKAGVDVTLDCWDDMIHVWQIYAPILTEGRQAIAKMADFIRRRVD